MFLSKFLSNSAFFKKLVSESVNPALKRSIDEIKTQINEIRLVQNEQKALLAEHSELLKQQFTILEEHSKIFKDHSEKLKEHSETLEKCMEYQGTNAENIAQNSFRITQIRYAILGDKLFDEPNWMR